MHGRASGVDVALALAGGIGVYRKTSGLRSFASVPLRVLVGPSGAPRTTSAMVERVADATHASADDARLRALGGLTDTGTTALAAQGFAAPQLDSLCEAARATGAYGAKLTGAGGGGAVIAIAPRDREAAILAEWKNAGVTGFVATVGGGVS